MNDAARELLRSPLGVAGPPLPNHPLAEQTQVYRAVTGSRLHGFAHPDSDWDYWVVVEEPQDPSPTLSARKIFQQVFEGPDEQVYDVTLVGLSTFLRLCANGAPQPLEALFSRQPELDLLGAPFRTGYRVDSGALYSSYFRVVHEAMNLAQAEADPRRRYKARRHAVRLCVNLDYGRRYGRFDPTLSSADKGYVMATANGDDFERLVAEHLAAPFPT